MLLVDTSVWIDHLRSGEERLTRLLENCEVVVHPFVIGELACGTGKKFDHCLPICRGLRRCRMMR